MGPAFVKRRMMAELGPGLAEPLRLLRAALLPPPPRSGRSTAPRAKDGSLLACKLQYPDMQSAVEADLQPARNPLRRCTGAWIPAIDTREIAKEIGARVREELDYRREAKHAALYADMLARRAAWSACPRVWPELSTARLLTLDWLEGEKLLTFKQHTPGGAQPHRDRHVQGLVAAVQPLRRDPRRSASRQLHGVLGGRRAAGHQPARLWLHPHLPAELRRRRRRPLQGPARGRPTTASSMPTRHGASRA